MFGKFIVSIIVSFVLVFITRVDLVVVLIAALNATKITGLVNFAASIQSATQNTTLFWIIPNPFAIVADFLLNWFLWFIVVSVALILVFGGK